MHKCVYIYVYINIITIYKCTRTKICFNLHSQNQQRSENVHEQSFKSQEWPESIFTSLPFISATSNQGDVLHKFYISVPQLMEIPTPTFKD